VVAEEGVAAAAELDELADPQSSTLEQPEAEISDPLADMDVQLRRALADLDNLQKRFAREVARERAAERARVASEWLPVVDNLELALEHADNASAGLVEGVRAVHDQAIAVLARLGFPRFLDLGALFDPRRHEAVGSVESDAPKGSVVATVRPGYGTNEQILRPAAVIVAQGA
jgi:molecular chaperone GrpE